MPRTTGLVIVVIAFLIGCVSAQDPQYGYGTLSGNTYLGNQEQINLGTGNLHIHIPLLTLPGRNGFDYSPSIDYNSQIWSGVGVITSLNPTVYGWVTPLNSPMGGTSLNQGWSFNAGEDFGGSLYYDNHVPSGTLNGTTVYCYANYRVKWGDGHVVSYPAIRTNCDYSSFEIHGPSGSQPPGGYCFSDRSVLQVPNSGSATLYMEDGTKLFPTTEDSNGNTLTAQDTVGRAIGGVPPRTSNYTYYDSAGNAQNIQFVYQNVNITPSLPSYGNGNYVPPGSTAWSMLSTVILANGDRWDFSYDNNGELSKITYPSGGYTGYTYAPAGTATACYTGPAAGNSPCSPGFSYPTLQVVTKTVCRDPNTRANGFNCSPGLLDPPTTLTPNSNNTQNIVVDPLGNQTVYTFTSNYLETQRSIYQGTTTLLRTITTTPSCDGPTQQTVTLNDSPGTPLVSKTIWTRGTPITAYSPGLTSSANVTQKVEYDWGPGQPGPLLRTTNYTWLQTNPVNNVDYTAVPVRNLSRKASETVLDSAGNTVAQTTYEYDNYTYPNTCGNAMCASGAIQHDSAFNTSYTPRGNLTKISRWLNTNNTWLNTINTYDDAGNVLTTKDPNGNVTTFSYTDNFANGSPSGATKAYVTQTTLPATNGVSHISRKQYYFNTGLTAASCGQNFAGGTCTNAASLPQADFATTTYDALGRALIATAGDGGQTTVTYSDDQANPPAQFSATTSSLIVSGTSKTSTAVMDGLGNVVQTQASDPEGTDYVDTTYDAIGRKSTVSNPHRSGTLLTDGITTFNYDGLSRTTSVAEPDGSTLSTAYAGNQVTVTDEASKQRKSVSDALGRLIEVDEPATVAPGTLGTDQITINGNEQIGQVYYVCGPNNQLCSRPVYDSGTVHVTVGGFTASAIYGGPAANGQAVAANLAENLNGPSSPVTAFAMGNVITVTSRASGSSSNFSVSTSTTWDTTDFTGPSFTASPATPTLTGGTNPGSGGSTPSLSDPFVTIYGYDTLNNLTRVEQHGSAPTDMSQWRTRSFTYDSLSRLLCGSNPEIAAATVTCPTSGTFPFGAVTYTYDSDGNALTKTAPAPNQPSTGTNNETVTYSYDALNRVFKKSFSAITPLATPAIYYGYDGIAPTGCTPPALTDPYPKGRRTSMCDASGATSWKHEYMGRILSETQKIATITNSTSYTYNLDGSVNQITYPVTGKVITYGYSNAGRALSAQDTAGSINYATAALYAPAGELTQMKKGAFITVNDSYNDRLQPTLLSATTSAATIMSLSYDFHASTQADNGNVFQIVNNRDNNRTQNFTYDALNRIQQANSSGPNWGEIFTIDAWGNLTNKGPVSGKTSYEGLSVSATTQNRLSGFNYDPAGNMTQNGAQYFYDAENHLTSAGGGYSYIYDGDGNRVEKCSAGTTPGTCATSPTGTLYWMGTGSSAISETNLSGAMQQEYIFFNGQRIARRDASNNVHYYHEDELGSTSLVTDANGTMSACPTNSSLITGEDESDYYPYGGEITLCNRVPQNYKFTGKERDSESGLDNFGARYFTSSIGRFMTPDWAARATAIPYAVFGDPQSLNLYDYVRNDPVSRNDPDGHKIDCINNNAQCQKDLQKLAPGTKVDENGHVQKASVLHRVVNHLDGHGAGTALVTRLVNNSETVKVNPDPAQAAGNAGPGIVNYNPNGVNGVPVINSQGNITIGSASGADILGHELIHQDHRLNGGQDNSIVEHVFEDSGSTFSEFGRKEEFRTVGFSPFVRPGDITENQLRHEQGEPDRATYDFGYTPVDPEQP